MTAVLVLAGIASILAGEIIGLRNRTAGDTITGMTERHPATFVGMIGLLCWALGHFVFATQTAEIVGLVIGAGLGGGLHRWGNVRRRRRR